MKKVSTKRIFLATTFGGVVVVLLDGLSSCFMGDEISIRKSITKFVIFCSTVGTVFYFQHKKVKKEN